MKYLTNKAGLGLCIIVILAACNTQSSIDEKASKPNIILLLADDLGYGDLTCYGGQAVHTPNIDNLAQAGIRFTRFYSASAVCTPSRTSILTGKYPLRFDIRMHFKDAGEHLPAGIETLPKNAS